jgi:hypothetical protein
MNIRKALKQAKKQGKRISSESASMYEQNPNTLLYWLLKDEDTSYEGKASVLKRILEAGDWKVDGE